MLKKLIIPTLTLLLIITAFALRWDYKAQKTFDNGVAQWKVDRWTGQHWQETYLDQDFKEIPIGIDKSERPQAHNKRNTANGIALLLLLSNIGYIGYIIKTN
jgi:hypothetical protein